MKRYSLVLALMGLVCLTAASRPVAETFEPDEYGYIRNWLVLAPIPLAEGQSGLDGLNKVGVKDEGTITPKDGEKATVAGKEYVWKKCQSTESHLDFNEILGGMKEDCVGYAVCYVWVEDEVKNLKLKMGSDDQARVWLNGTEVLKFEEPRPLTKDQDTAENITLKKGRNVIVFKVVNEKIDFSGSIRFMDANDSAFKGFKVSVAPEK
jgi:hypothetical protein